MKDQPVFHGEFFRVQHHLVGVTDARISSNAPGLVADDARTVNAGSGFAIFVAVEDTRTID
jgi:hypothetical protein